MNLTHIQQEIISSFSASILFSRSVSPYVFLICELIKSLLLLPHTLTRARWNTQQRSLVIICWIKNDVDTTRERTKLWFTVRDGILECLIIKHKFTSFSSTLQSTTVYEATILHEINSEKANLELMTLSPPPFLFCFHLSLTLFIHFVASKDFPFIQRSN